MRKRPALSRLFCRGVGTFLFTLSLLVTSYAESAVTLLPQENYVIFGKYDHRLVRYNGAKESDSGPISPILWRVMELKSHSGAQKGAVLLSHHLLESMAYQKACTNSGAEEPNKHKRPDGETAHTWDGSEVQSWLNSDGDSVRVKLGQAYDYRDIKGFLHRDYFSISERNLMLDYPYNRYSEGERAPAGEKVTLPSGKSEEKSGSWYDLYEMGTWFASAENDANNNTRKAHFKGGPTDFTEGDPDGGYYWTRSPFTSYSLYVSLVYNEGYVYLNDVRDPGVAVRPVFFLNLDPLIFKSASNPLPSADTAGSKMNPYLLYLPTRNVPAKSLIPTVTVNRNRLTLTFTPPMAEYQGIFHAYADTADTATLSGRFTIANAKASGISFSGNSISFVLDKTYTCGDTRPMPTVAYTGSAATDGIGFVNRGITPTTLARFSAVKAANLTPELENAAYRYRERPEDRWQR